MYVSNRVRVKICCISSEHEARTAIQYGADALGLVGKMPSGPGIIENALAAEIVRLTPPPIATFMLTSEATIEEIMVHYKSVKSSAIQLVDSIPEALFLQLSQQLPPIKLVQVIHVRDESNVDQALKAVETGADALLLDSGNPALQTKELGGTGRTHNWKISRRIVDQSPVPVFLAGGLHAGNVKQALDEVCPFGLDVCSGVRTLGHLDQRKLEAFMSAL